MSLPSLLLYSTAALLLSSTRATAARSPAGPLSCVHEVPHGALVRHNTDAGGGFTVRHPSIGTATIAPCRSPRRASAAPTTSPAAPAASAAPAAPAAPAVIGDAATGFKGGWQVYAKQNVGSSLTGFTGTWTVPDAPAVYTGQTVFLFTGLQSSDWVPPDAGPKGKFDIIRTSVYCRREEKCRNER